MNTRIRAIIASLALAAGAHAQSTAFTYQGELKQGGNAANGTFDLRFKLFDAAGAQVGTSQCANNVQVAGGTFTTSIDFGQQFVTSAQRFIEIEVRPDTGLDCASAGGFVVLAPRQAVTAAPLAAHAKTAFSLAAADGSPANAVTVDINGQVGIGTPTPTHSVHIANPAPTLALQDTDSAGTIGGQQVGYLSYRDNTNVERGWIGYGSVGDPDLSIVNARPGGDIILNAATGNVGILGANVGIGTAAPASKLEVRGDIRMGATGSQFAARGEENLRMLRGEVRRDGLVQRGLGFTAQRVDIGKYVVTFTTPFASAPTVVVSGIRDGGSSVAIANVDAFTPVTPSQVTIICWTTFTDDYSNEPFNFIAIGPP